MLSKKLEQEINEVDATKFKQMLIAATKALEEAETEINDLNVFPVPDGDTGSNMCSTIFNAVEEAKKVKKDSVGAVAEELSNGALMGARGNSGVILSQLLKGLANGIGDSKSLTPQNLARGLKKAADVSYQAVMKPVEGTILTVAREAGERAEELVETEEEIDIVQLLLEVVEQAEKSVVKTKEMLDTLEEADVVDAGGKGYEIFLEGLLKGLVDGGALNEQLERIHQYEGKVSQQVQEEATEYGYCTEFIVRNPSISTDEFKDQVEEEGDSLLVIEGQDVIRVHIHTEHPGRLLETGLKYGELSQIKIDNMDEQHNERLTEAESESGESSPADDSSATETEEREPEMDKLAVLAVTVGDGLSKIFKNLGAEYVLEGGQSMNPSTQDLLDGLNTIKANKVIILPNNKNVISTAEQVEKLVEKEIEVIQTKNTPQGIAAMMAFNPYGELAEVSNEMQEELKFVKTGQVTYAVRETQINGLDIEKGDILGVADEEIEVVCNDYNQATLELINKLTEPEDSLVTVYAGEDVAPEEKQELKDKLQEEYSEFDIEVYDGKQPIYYYIVSVE